ncbi:hypothetical protein A9Q97_01215 [Rhodospirillales bacterium 47_12_T64]|nr:hypothetical protein A9Q97_01215 [Rhodospirillales bacterium 47_12_T64]
MRILLVHGWGYGPDIWNSVIPQLDPEIECTIADLGFSGTMKLPTGHYDIAVGHSMGLLWLLSKEKVSWDKLVSINGFTKFSASDDFPQGVSARVLERMIRKIPHSAQGVLKSFHAQCDPLGIVPFKSLANLDEERMIWGLEFLRDMDLRNKYDPSNTLVLAEKDDLVITQEMTSALFQESEIRWVEGKGHLVPLSAPNVCYEIIERAISE